MNTSKELTTQQAGGLSIFQAEADFVDSTQVSASDIRLSYLLLAQKSSTLFDRENHGNVKIGDVYDSTTEEVVCKKGDTLQVVPLTWYKQMHIKFKEGDRWETKERLAWKPEFEKLPYEEEKNGQLQQNHTVYYLVCMLAKDLGTPAAIPYVMVLRGASKKTGQDMVKDYMIASQSKAPFMQAMLEFYTAAETNDSGDTFQVFKKKVMKPNPKYKENETLLKYWKEQFEKGLAKVAPDDEPSETVKDVTGNF